MKIALIGAAPSSMEMAPFDNPEWTIWCCSPSVARYGAPRKKRVDAWFEIHSERWTRQLNHGDYLDWLKEGQGFPIYMIEARTDYPGSVKYPLDEMLAEFGHDCFTSSVSYMLAYAITQKPEEIGLWGIDLAAEDEYLAQRQGAKHLMWVAQQRGIEVTAPAESDIMVPTPLYSYRRETPMGRKFDVRKAELEKREAMLANRLRETNEELIFVRGALSDMRYWENIWL